MWAVIAVLALVFALASASLSAVVFLSLSKKLEQKDISKLLEKSSEEVSGSFARSLRAIQTEWEDVYQKFMRLTGRVEKTKAVDFPSKDDTPTMRTTMTRSDLLRKHKEGK